MLFVFHVPYVIPVVMGLVGGPASALSVVCGVIVYFTLHVVTQNAANVSGDLSDILGQIRLIIDSLLGNKQMLVLAVAFAKEVLIKYAWFMGVYVLITYIVCTIRYNISRRKLKRYFKNLKVLKRMYD